MSTQENLRLVKKGYAAFGAGNIEELLGLFAEDIEWTTPTIKDAPFGGTVRGRSQVGKFFESLAGAEEFQEFTPEDFIAQDDKVVVTGRSRALVKSTGRTLALEWVHIFTVNAGKVQRFVEFFDTAAVAEAYRQKAAAGA